MAALLRAQGIEELILTGMQTELCIDATCRRAAALGYRVTIISDGHSTFDFEDQAAAETIAQHNAAWAKLVTVEPAAEITLE